MPGQVQNCIWRTFPVICTFLLACYGILLRFLFDITDMYLWKKSYHYGLVSSLVHHPWQAVKKTIDKRCSSCCNGSQLSLVSWEFGSQSNKIKSVYLYFSYILFNTKNVYSPQICHDLNLRFKETSLKWNDEYGLGSQTWRGAVALSVAFSSQTLQLA